MFHLRVVQRGEATAPRSGGCIAEMPREHQSIVENLAMN
jgi:hypothetical protein